MVSELLKFFSPKNMESWLILDSRILDEHPCTFSLKIPLLELNQFCCNAGEGQSNSFVDASPIRLRLHGGFIAQILLC